MAEVGRNGNGGTAGADPGAERHGSGPPWTRAVDSGRGTGTDNELPGRGRTEILAR
ncbi:hypothetical protein EHYA_09121 [Embleya hyalina]|uniref:Uncharacterized protein n=1 Tax=Embleya hyalina TaxID=516124 RepID=A0A401Z392_9ACTN|nr:hypothetical protein EHYA_09121 [Embleya hyalina]